MENRVLFVLELGVGCEKTTPCVWRVPAMEELRYVIVQCACTVVLQDKIIPAQSKENMEKEVMKTKIEIYCIEERKTIEEDGHITKREEKRIEKER
jgi:hypothetical protein